MNYYVHEIKVAEGPITASERYHNYSIQRKKPDSILDRAARTKVDG